MGLELDPFVLGATENVVGTGLGAIRPKVHLYKEVPMILSQRDSGPRIGGVERNNARPKLNGRKMVGRRRPDDRKNFFENLSRFGELLLLCQFFIGYLGYPKQHSFGETLGDPSIKCQGAEWLVTHQQGFNCLPVTDKSACDFLDFLHFLSILAFAFMSLAELLQDKNSIATN